MKELDFSIYVNTIPYADYKTDRVAFDTWANRNDYLVEEFITDVTQYMNDWLVKNKLDRRLKINSLRKIAELAVNEKDTPKDQFLLCMEILELLK